MTEVTLAHGDARATIARLGAEARQWRIAGRDLLWPGDPAIWSDISPILFPVVGWTRNGEERVEGRRYALGLHGFARFETFAVEFLEARLRPADPRRQCAHAGGLSVHLRARGRIPAHCRRARDCDRSRQSRRRPAPYACGLHPGFRWPLGAAGREGAFVRFDKAGAARSSGDSRRADLSARPTRPIPLRGRDLPLTDALFAHDALCFLDCTSRSLAFHRRLGRVDHHGVSGAFRTPRCGRGPARRSSASRLGPATAIRTALRATCSTSPACGCSSRESARAMRRASSSGRAEASSECLRKDDP